MQQFSFLLFPNNLFQLKNYFFLAFKIMIKLLKIVHHIFKLRFSIFIFRIESYQVYSSTSQYRNRSKQIPSIPNIPRSILFVPFIHRSCTRIKKNQSTRSNKRDQNFNSKVPFRLSSIHT